jgi:predicted transport protein
MSDLKLFRLDGRSVLPLPVRSADIEKSLQTLLESHLETFLGVRLLASEYATGKNHGGRIDTLGMDENGCPVIIEYKRALNENVINQGLYYLDWLLDHKAEFILLVQKKCGPAAAEAVDWPGARLLCIAGEFTKFDEYAVKQIARNIELLRYRRYGEDLLLLELVNSSVGAAGEGAVEGGAARPRAAEATVEEKLARAGQELKDRYESLKAFLLALGDDVQEKQLKLYFAFKRIKNFACVEIHPQNNKIVVFVKADFDAVKLEEGFTRDVRKIGHYGTGDLEISIGSDEDLERARPLIVRSYEEN